MRKAVKCALFLRETQSVQTNPQADQMLFSKNLKKYINHAQFYKRKCGHNK